MFVVRLVNTSDIPMLEALAETATPEVHTLPRRRETIARAVERSTASLSGRGSASGEESYFFALESSESKTIVGAAAISARAGGGGTFFAFRKDVLNQVSRDLNISHDVLALSLCSDLTSHSQLSGFYLRDRARAGEAAALLSRSRLMFAAIAPERFSERFFASMAGRTDENGRSPFWEALGRKFFQMDFLAAERMIEGARNRTVIVELMPHYPVYVPLLPAEAQAAMGQVHEEGTLACRILTEEGFTPDAYLDIFDGGPILKAHRNALRSFSDSSLRMVDTMDDEEVTGNYLIATARENDFRATLAPCVAHELSDRVMLPQETMRLLDVAVDDTVLCARL